MIFYLIFEANKLGLNPGGVFPGWLTTKRYWTMGSGNSTMQIAV